ncbi:hypothetical protein [Candidatus Electronema sp. PJ]|uniref:hypothetical protein n=1 Tax=Candidatus Electronema sp. PJ TaxID=3401572 RepID=UPI003AA7E35C
MKKLLIAAGTGIGVLVAAVLLAPTLLSSNWVRNMALTRLNKSIPGKLAAESCTIGWQQGLECAKVHYADPKQGFQLEIAELRSSQALWPLITAPEELGEITLNEPTLLFTLKPEPPAAAPASQAKVEQGASGPAAPGLQAKKAAPKEAEDSFLEKMRGKLTIHKMLVKVSQAGQSPQVLLRNGSLKAETAAGELKFDLLADTAEEGTAAFSGSTKLNELTKGSLKAADFQLKLNEVQTKPFLALKPGEKGLPQGSGKLSAEISLKGGPDGGLAISGPMSLIEVDLTGGALGLDHPRFSQLTLTLDMRQQDKGWQFPSLKLVSDFGNLNFQCTYSGDNLQGSGKGQVDLSLLLAQFPHLLKVRDDLRLDRGELNLSVELVKEGGRLQVAVDAAADSLAGRQNSESFSWEYPLSLHVVGSVVNQEPEVESLALTAPFLNLEGKGNLKQFSLAGEADLDQTMREVNRIFRSGWDAGGKLQLQLQLAHSGNDRYQAAAEVGIADFRLSRQGKEILPPHKASFSGKLNAPGKFPESSQEAAELTFDLASLAGTVSGSFEGIYRKNGKLSTGYQVQVKLLLAQLVELLHKFEALDQETSLAGTLNLHTSGYTEDSRVVLRELDSQIKDFILYQQGKVFREPELHLRAVPTEATPAADKAVRPLIEADSRAAFFADGGGHSLIDPVSHRLILRDLEFTSSFAEIKLQQLALEDWQHKPMPVLKNVQISGKSDLAKLTVLLQQLGKLTPDKKLGGAATFTIELAGQPDGKGNNGTVEIDLDRFMYGKEGSLLAARDKTEFRSKLHGDLAAGDIYFTTFDLLSPPLAVQSSGKLELAGKNPHLTLEGMATPDLADLVAVINGMYPLGISAEGKQKEKFSLYYPLTATKQQVDLRFAGKVHADTFAKSGIEISDLSAETAMQKGIMNAALKGSLNGGKVQFTPTIDYTHNPPLLTLAAPEQILDHVGLAETLADGLLKHFHPLLGALARPAGIISVRAERLSLPVGGKGLDQADFQLRFDLASVVLEPVSALAGILDMAGLAGQQLQLKEKSLTCEGKKGRVSCSPIKITIAESEMVMSGSAGFDGSLDYVLEVPVTKNLVGKKGYELLKGARLKVPIKGTKEKPVYNPEALMRAASDLVSQAAGQAAKQVLQEQVKKVVPKELEKVVPNLPGLIDGLFGR